MRTTALRSSCLAAIALALVISGDAGGQSIAVPIDNSIPAPVLPQYLKVFTEIPLSVPPFGYLRTAQCDDSGTMFFAAALPPRTGVTYLSISSDGQKQTVYHLPQEVVDMPYNTLFSVTPDGMLQLLLVVPGQQAPRWFTFQKNGEVSRVVTLSAPVDIDVQSFSTTAQGYLLLVGYHPLTKAHVKDEGETYTAIFNDKGELVTKLTAEASGMQANGEFAGSPDEPAAVEGEEFFWIDSAGKKLVVTATDGSIVRRMPLPGARPGDQVMGLHISGHMALISYVNFKATPRMSYLLVDASTGDRYGLFLQPSGVKASLGCFDSSRGFTVLSGDRDHLTLLRSLLP